MYGNVYMSKATLQFDLSDYDEKLSHIRAVKADDTIIAISDFFNVLRQGWKYGVIDNDKLTDKQIDLCEKMRDKLVYILENYKVDYE